MKQIHAYIEEDNLRKIKSLPGSISHHVNEALTQYTAVVQTSNDLLKRIKALEERLEKNSLGGF